MKIQSFNIANFKVDGGAMFGVVPKVLWSKSYPADDQNMIVLSLRTLVIETNGRVIITDNGFGDKQSDKFFSHFHIFGGDGLIEGLAKLGYKPEDVTDVILTHLHYDHCGGGIKRNAKGEFELVFPRAKYHVSRMQWESAMNPNVREADSFLMENLVPMQQLGALNLIENDTELLPGVSLRIFNGHTSGQIIPIISLPNGKTLVYSADLFPSTAHIPLAWNMSYDVEPLVTMKEKEIFLSEAHERDYILFYQHDYYTECSKLIKNPKGIRVGDKLTLSDVLEK